MKTYPIEKLELLLDQTGSKTIKTKGTKNGMIYLDYLANGEYAVSKDEYNIGVFNHLNDAVLCFNTQLIQNK